MTWLVNALKLLLGDQSGRGALLIALAGIGYVFIKVHDADMTQLVQSMDRVERALYNIADRIESNQKSYDKLVETINNDDSILQALKHKRRNH